MDYAQAGVSIEAGDTLVKSIRGMVESTFDQNVHPSFGGYASLYRLNRRQLLAAGTDGVGTKLKLAQELNRHDTIGIDLVAMCVNDVICVGATPLFFLDYFATSKLDPSQAAEVVKGIVKACKLAKCSLVGGETAEMPGMYQPGDYDLAGFCVGIVDKKAVLPKESIKPGDVLIGMRSDGFHSNGFSLLRKLVETTDADQKIREELLTPTRIYVNSVSDLIDRKLIKGAAHITGGGMLNVLRMSKDVSYQIQLPSLGELARPFQWLHDLGKVEFSETCRTFNCGLGMVLVVSKKKKDKVLKRLKESGEIAWVVGETVENQKQSTVEVSNEMGNRAVLQ